MFGLNEALYRSGGLILQCNDLRTALNGVFAVASDVGAFVLPSFGMVSCEYRLAMYLRRDDLHGSGDEAVVRS